MTRQCVAGPYTATYNGLAVGQTAEGYRLSHQFFKRVVTGDAMAQTPQDGVYQGCEMYLAMNLIEYNKAATQSIMWPYGSSYLAHGQVGRMDVQSSLSKQIVLSAVTGTPAADSPASITLPLCILAEGFPVELLLAPDLRIVPLRMRVYPSDATPAADSVFGTKT